MGIYMRRLRTSAEWDALAQRFADQTWLWMITAALVALIPALRWWAIVPALITLACVLGSVYSKLRADRMRKFRL